MTEWLCLLSNLSQTLLKLSSACGMTLIKIMKDIHLFCKPDLIRLHTDIFISFLDHIEFFNTISVLISFQTFHKVCYLCHILFIESKVSNGTSYTVSLDLGADYKLIYTKTLLQNVLRKFGEMRISNDISSLNCQQWGWKRCLSPKQHTPRHMHLHSTNSLLNGDIMYKWEVRGGVDQPVLKCISIYCVTISKTFWNGTPQAKQKEWSSCTTRNEQ